MGVYFHEYPRRETPYPLARHVLHDDRSREFDATTLVRQRPLVTTLHESVCPPWDQGQVGSCTANAALGCLMTRPLWNGSWGFTEADALRLYEDETRIDDRQIPGHYPPDDTGSTFLWSAKALQRRGLIRSYRHAFSLKTALQLLLDWPVSTGLPWYDSMFTVDRSGTIVYDESSGIRGGHQVCLVGVDVDRKAVRVRNSWGTGWGEGGYAWLGWSAYNTLLHQQGDAGVLVV
jgi:Papain family cysteine protease